mmetsp:Transcript_11727/g.21322  ORF Transcript_11727/g.21322 Transcript_11727/m.21322 type:complete len:282 (-) Transcript_11727:51-896(-)
MVGPPRWRRSKKTDADAPVIEFDPASRHRYIYGFRKRKQARRKQGAMEAIERARQEKIGIKKSYRDDVKQRIKELQWATNHIDRCLGDASGRARALALEAADGSEDEMLADAQYDGQLEDGVAERATPEVKKVVHFSREGGEAEEDDPFGDCEVTTTHLEVSGPSAIVATDESWAQNGSRKPLLTLAAGDEDALALKGMQDKAALQGIDLAEHKRRRKINLLADERRRVKAMERQVKRDERLKKVREPKKQKKRKDRIKAQRAGSKNGGGKKGGKRRNKRL